MRSLNSVGLSGGGSNLPGAMHGYSGGSVGGAGVSVNGSRRETPPGGESAEAIAARLARDDARIGAKPKRSTRDLAQGAGMHAALGLGVGERGESGAAGRLLPPAAQAKRKGSEGRLAGAPANLVL
jgi:hypothetical protein